MEKIAEMVPGLKRCTVNRSVYISRVCPFCLHERKKPFRYNSKLKVGKSYCCGVSFKDAQWLKKLIEDPFSCKIKREITDNSLLSSHQKAVLESKYRKDKILAEEWGFDKSEPDDYLPF